MKKTIVFVLLSCVLLWSQSFDGASMGMAGNYSAMSRGVNSIAWNPANLALPRGNTFELNIFSINTMLFNSSFSINNYNRYFTEEGHDGEWSESDKREIADLLPEDGLSLNLDTGLNLFGAAYNNFGFAVQLIGYGKARLAKKPFEIFLFGENFGKDYLLDEPSMAETNGYSAIKWSFGYGYPFKIDKYIDIKKYLPGISDVAVGMNFNYYMGMAVAQTLESNVLVERIEEDMIYNVRMEARTSTLGSGFPAGNGIGFDLGLSAKYDDDWHFSLSFNNLFGSIYWSKNTEKTIVVEADSSAFFDLFEENNEDHSVSEDTTFSCGGFSTSLPITMRLGAVYQVLPKLKLSFDWHQALNEQFGNDFTPRIGVGAEYYAQSWLPLRSGIAIGGGQGFLLGLGFGLQFKYFEFDLSYAMKEALWPTYSKGVFTAMSMKYMF